MLYTGEFWFADALKLALHAKIDADLTPSPHNGVTIQFVDLPEGTVCRIDVTPLAPPGLTYLAQEVFVRVGSESRRLTGRQLIEWQESRRTT